MSLFSPMHSISPNFFSSLPEFYPVSHHRKKLNRVRINCFMCNFLFTNLFELVIFFQLLRLSPRPSVVSLNFGLISFIISGFSMLYMGRLPKNGFWGVMLVNVSVDVGRLSFSFFFMISFMDLARRGPMGRKGQHFFWSMCLVDACCR
ncbi:hypothetical protein DFH27DRAFT_651170 [Peziza echinospora]|nr:hypothetical protein DFH27DRAFT_651170 [Peziza echinospora]